MPRATKPLRIYWAGDRAFAAGARWHDFEAVRILEERTGWSIDHPFMAVHAAFAKPNPGAVYGTTGMIRRTCLRLLRRADLVVAYVGGYDTGTAQEIEAASAGRIPVLAWSDAALFRGEIANGGRDVAISQENLAELPAPAVPLNAMTTNFDLYLEFSRLDAVGISPGDLASRIEAGVRSLLKDGRVRPRVPRRR